MAHTIISDLNDYASDSDNDSLLFSLLGSNVDIGLEVFGNQLNLTSLTPEFNGQAQYGVVASDGVLSDTSYFNLIVDPRGDKVFLFKQVSSDTLLTSGTSTLILDGVEYNSNNGIVQLQVTPGSYELDGTHTNSLDHDMPAWATYTFIRRLGDSYNLEQRAHLDNSSQVYLDAQDDTLQIYELLMDFPIDDVIATADDVSEGTRRFAPSVIDSIPVWLNLNYQPLDSTQRAWTDSLFAELKRIPHMKDFNFVIYEGTQQPTIPHLEIAVDESFPAPGTNITVYNANHEITACRAAYPVSPSPSMAVWYIEILQAINDLTDIGGTNPNLLDGTNSSNVWLNDLAKKLYSLVSLADPHTIL